jgi:hypothetical protein
MAAVGLVGRRQRSWNERVAAVREDIEAKRAAHDVEKMRPKRLSWLHRGLERGQNAEAPPSRRASAHGPDHGSE